MSNEKKTFIAEPFQTPIQDVNDAQALEDEELELSEPGAEADAEDAEGDAADDGELRSFEESDADLARLAETLEEQTQEYVKELEKLAASEEKDSAERLAREIAEDVALEKEMAEEAEKPEATDPELAAALPKEPVADESGELDLSEVESCIEALLFMMDKPCSSARLRELLGPEFSLSIFQEALTSLKKRYEAVHHGIELVEVGGGYQFRTKPGRAALAKKLARVQTQRLSSGAMETLAIVAYRQPVLKDDIDKVRGVDSSHFIRTLLDRKLIKIAGRSEAVGRPLVYATTPEFLELFGLKDLSAMPSLREIEQMVPTSQTPNPEEEDPRVREMRRLVGEMKTDRSTSLVYDPKEDEKILKEIRERVQSIPTSTPYLEEQRELEKAEREREKLGTEAAAVPGLEGLSAAAVEAPSVPAEIPADPSST